MARFDTMRFCSLVLLSTLWLSLQSGVTGCTQMPPVDDGGVDGDIPSDAAISVGTGEGVFTAFEDNETLELVAGCQGAQHVWVSLRSWGLETRGTIIELELLRTRDSTVVSDPFVVRVSFLRVENEAYAEIIGMTLVVQEPDEALGEDLIISARVRDVQGRQVTLERPIQLEWGPPACRSGASGDGRDDGAEGGD